MILGHQRCGAIISVHQNIMPSEYITYIAEHIKPAYELATQKITPEYDIIDLAIRENIYWQMKQALEISPVLNNSTENGRLAIVGAYYNLESEQIEILQDAYYQYD